MGIYTETAERLARGFGAIKAEDGTWRIIIAADDETADGQTLRSMVFAADQAGIYHDDAYKMVRDALQQIADTDPDEIMDTERDGLIEVYTDRLMQWIARNWQLADEMKEEYGNWPESLDGIASATQDYAFGLVFGCIESNWPADDDTDEEEDEEDI